MQRDEAASQQAESDQQHEREHQFRDDQHTPGALRTGPAARRVAGVPEALGEIDAGRLERRREPEYQSGDQRCEQAEAQYPSIDAETMRAGT